MKSTHSRILYAVMFVATLPAFSGAEESPNLSKRYQEAATKLIGAALTSDVAYDRLSELCDGIGHRLSGSPHLERAIEWAAETMRQDGLEVRLQPVMVPKWVRGEESAELLEPRPVPLHILGLGNSIGTPEEGITADVLVVRSFEELEAMPDAQVRGKIVLYNVPFTTYGETVRYRSAGADSAAKKGAVAALVRSVGPVSLDTPHTGALRYRKDKKLPAAALTIEGADMIQRLHDRGIRIRMRLKMEAHFEEDALSYNVIGDLLGSETPEEVVVVGGHLDSWDVGQGTHDDGGGCVAAMEVARLIRQTGLKPRRTLRVVLWTNEENGLRGGRAYKDSLSQEELRNHVAAIESDGGMEEIVGFGFRFHHESGDETGRAKHEIVLRRAQGLAPLLSGLGASRIMGNGGGADIGPLMRAGVVGIGHRTIMDLYWHIHHTKADTLDKIDPQELKKNVAAMAVVSYVLADMPGRLDDPLDP